MMLVLYLLGGYLVLTTLLSRVRSFRWWVRFADFPRLQVTIGLLVVMVLMLVLVREPTPFELVFGAALLLSFAYNTALVLPYTPLTPHQVKDAEGDAPDRTLRLLISNVLMENRRAEAVVAMVRRHQPDLFLAVETDAFWAEQLSVLDADYPFGIKQPQDNHYGMTFFSRLPIEDLEVLFRVDADVPSIRCRVRLPSGDEVVFHGLHPRPPLPKQGTEVRDAELLLVGREIIDDGRPTIVAGDLNDVAWSHTTRLFQRTSGLLDPRRGRGMYATFHSGYPLMRWPLDHVFHDAGFTLVHLRCLENVGSDHLPVLIELQRERAAEKVQEEPRPDAEDRAEASETIDQAVRTGT